MTQSIENSTLSLIKYIDDITRSIDSCVEIFGKSSTPNSLVEYIPCIEQCVKEIDKTVVMIPGEIQTLITLYKGLFSSLEETRNSLVCKINERKAKEIQMNTNGNLYNEDNLFNEIVISIDDFAPKSILDVRIDTIIDPNKYSILSIVNQFNNEKSLLSDLQGLIVNKLSDSYTIINTFKENLLKVKSMLNDGEVINQLLEGNVTTYNTLLAGINGTTFSLTRLRNSLKLIFKIYKALIANYGIYSEAINQYTSLVLESFFNSNSSFEIC